MPMTRARGDVVRQRAHFASRGAWRFSSSVSMNDQDDARGHDPGEQIAQDQRSLREQEDLQRYGDAEVEEVEVIGHGEQRI